MSANDVQISSLRGVLVNVLCQSIGWDKIGSLAESSAYMIMSCWRQ